MPRPLPDLASGGGRDPELGCVHGGRADSPPDTLQMGPPQSEGGRGRAGRGPR